jgi:hypothetical protein
MQVSPEVLLEKQALRRTLSLRTTKIQTNTTDLFWDALLKSTSAYS